MDARRPSILRSLEAFAPPPDEAFARERCDAVVQRLSAARGARVLFADVVAVQWRKAPKMVEVLAVVDAYGLLFVHNEKLMFTIHLLELMSLVTTRPTEITISATISAVPATFSNHAQSQSTAVGDEIAGAVVRAWADSFPTARECPFQILIPDSRSAAIQVPPSQRLLVCGGVMEAYSAACHFIPGFISPREDFADIFELLHAQSVTRLRMTSFPNLDSAHLAALLHAVKFNAYFTELMMERAVDSMRTGASLLEDKTFVHAYLHNDEAQLTRARYDSVTGAVTEMAELIQPKYAVDGEPAVLDSGLAFDEVAEAAFVGLLGYNRAITKVVAPSMGLTATTFLQLRDAMNERASRASLSVKWLDVSDNAIGDSGVEALAEVLAALPYMPAALGLARLGITRKGRAMVGLLNAFRRNVFTGNSLSALNLSDNKFDTEAMSALAAWLALPNCLQALGLANTGVNLDKISDALSRGCVSQLRCLDLSRNGIKSCASLLLFMKTSQSLQILDLSQNPLVVDSLQDLLRTLIVNFSLFDVDLRLCNIGLDADGAEVIFAMISNNIRKLNVGDNRLGAQGLEVVGSGMAVNTSLTELRVDRCFFAPKKQQRFVDSFCTFLRSNTTLKYLSMRGDPATCLRAELIPIIEELAKSKLVAVDITGHEAGDALGVTIGRVLKANKTLRALDYDFNGVGAHGLEYIREGLDSNTTVHVLSIPVHDIATMTKSSKSNKSAITAIVRAIEARLAANAAALANPVAAASAAPTTSAMTAAASAAAPDGVRARNRASMARPSLTGALLPAPGGDARRLTIFSGGDLKYVNTARQRELDNMVHRIRCTGRTLTPEQEKVFGDVAYHTESLGALQLHQEAVLDQLNTDLQKLAEKLAKDASELITKAHAAIESEALEAARSKYKSVGSDAQASLANTLTATCPPYSSDLIAKAAADTCHLGWRRLEAEASRVLMSVYANFLYDTFQSGLEGVLQGIVAEGRERLESSVTSGTARPGTQGRAAGAVGASAAGSVRGGPTGPGGRKLVLTNDPSEDQLLVLPDEDWDSSGDELEKIMATGDIDQDKVRHQLLFGFPVRVHNNDGTRKNTGAQCQLYCDIELKKLMWRRPYQKHDSKDTVLVGDIVGIHAGKDMGKHFRDTKNLPDNRCFSILTPTFTLDLEAPTSKQRAKWVFALQLLVGGLIKTEEEEDDEDDYEFVSSNDLKSPTNAAQEEEEEEEDDDEDEYDDKPPAPQPPPQQAKPAAAAFVPRPLPAVPTVVSSAAQVVPHASGAIAGWAAAYASSAATAAPASAAPPPRTTVSTTGTSSQTQIELSPIVPAERPQANTVSAALSKFGTPAPRLSKAPSPTAASQTALTAPVAPLPRAGDSGLTHLNLTRPSGPKRRKPMQQVHYRDAVAASDAHAPEQTEEAGDADGAKPQARKADGGAIQVKYGKPQAGGDLTQEFLSRVRVREESGATAARLTKSGDIVTDAPAHTTRLYIIKGRRAIRPRLVECTHKSLNDGDAFVLDAPKTVFVWYGRNANKIERGAAAKFGTDYKNETRKGLVNVVYVEPHALPSVHKAFWEALGGEGEIASEEQGGNDIVVENAVRASLVLNKFAAGESGAMQMTRANVGGEELGRGMIEYGSASVMVLDAVTEVYVWEGKGTTKACRDAAKEHITALRKQRPAWTLFETMREGQEALTFRLKFADWPEPGKEAELRRRSQGAGNARNRKSLKSFDIGTMFAAAAATDTAEKKKKADAGWFDTHEQVTVDKYDDGKGQLEIWIVSDKSKLVPVPAGAGGQFHTAETYVLSYVWTYKEKKRCQLYCWQGHSCNGNKKGSGMLLMQEMLETQRRSKEFYEDPVSRRVLQFKENEHFRKLFAGRMVYLQGPAGEATENHAVQLFHLKPRSGAPAHDVVAVQVELSAAGLNSRDVFVLHTAAMQYVWFGKGARDDERKRALAVAEAIKAGRKQEVMDEGKEKSAFWATLGGQEHYASADYLRDGNWTPKLFECTLATGEYTAERIAPFTQDDLSVEYVYILDVFHEIYVWVGSSADKELVNMTMRIAVDYQRMASDGRPNDESSVLFVQPGAEPLMFTCHFLGWIGLARLRNRQQQRRAVRELLELQESKFPYKELIKRPPPPGLDVSRLETYLDDKEFAEVFLMPPAQFAKLPEWIRTNKKVEVGLY